MPSRPSSKTSSWKPRSSCRRRSTTTSSRCCATPSASSPNSPKVGWKAGNTKIINLTDGERAEWKDYLSVERNKDKLNGLIDQYGRKEYELVAKAGAVRRSDAAALVEVALTMPVRNRCGPVLGLRETLMRSIIAAIDKNVEFVLGVLLYIYIIAVVFGEVVARYGFGSSILWAEETSIYAFIWLTYISMAGLARSRSHLAFTAIRDALPPPAQLAMLLLADVCLLALSAVVIIYIYQPIADNVMFEQQMMGVNLPLWLATAAIPFGWLLVSIRVVQRSIDSIIRYRANEPLIMEFAALD